MELQLRLLPHSRHITRFWVVVALMLAWCWRLDAQVRDSKGKEFWVTFMPNEGSGFAASSDLRLYLSCDRPTTATVTYLSDNRTTTVTLPVADRAVEVNINTLFGNNTELDDVWSDRSNEVSRRSFYISCADEITVYGVNIRSKSADAFMSLPDDIITGRYIVMAYTNGYDGQINLDYDMPSQFAVVGTEQGTTVRITSPAIINGRAPDVPFTITLDSGTVFLGQARLGNAEDVSGTEIVANKPVAVYGGCKRTAVPTAVGNFRDQLVEQIPPLEAWGKGTIVTPLYPITPQSGLQAVVRVLAAFDGTSWTVNGVPQASLNSKRPVELAVTPEPMVIAADQPIIVAQYEHSVGLYDGPGQAALGDPFMMLLPPVEQFDSVYSFQCVPHPEFRRHFVNVVVPTPAIASLMIDGIPQNATAFRQIAGTTFSYAQFELSPGAHFARADSMFGLYIYGYGSANSYGYPGGSLYEQIVVDFQAPEMAYAIACDRLTGLAYDSRITDTGVDSCYTVAGSANVNVTIDPFIPGADTVLYHAVLVDPYQDGRVAIKAIDSGGRSQTRVTDIPGFTLRAQGVLSGGPTALDTLVVFNGREFCKTFEVENYGKFEQTIKIADFGGGNVPGLRVNTPMPLTVPPAGKVTIELCYDGLLDTMFAAEVSIGDSCARRAVAGLPIISRIDRNAPDVSRADEPCAGSYLLTINEPARQESGIASVIVEEVVNGTATVAPDSAGLPTDRATVTLLRDDPRKDLTYRLRLLDAVGNERVVADTIGGFTLAVLAMAGDTLGSRFDHVWAGDSIPISGQRCDSLMLVNYGARTLTLRSIKMLGNRVFSIPPAQIPLDIPPGGTVTLQVCTEGLVVGDAEDSLVIDGGCGIGESILLKAPVAWVYGAGSDICNNSISIQMLSPTKRTFLTAPVPNPTATDAAYVDIGLTGAGLVSMRLADVNGRPVKRILGNVFLPAGINRVEFDVSDLDNGMYFVRMDAGDGSSRVVKLVVRR